MKMLKRFVLLFVALVAAVVEYQHCGENYFRVVFQGSSLVYISGAPAQ
jgi:hypothetical protein